MSKYNNQITEGLSYDDVLLKPQKTRVTDLSQVSTQTKLGNLDLSLPVLSAPMDTVTEDEMAAELAQKGGLGVIHRFMPVSEQAKQISKVKQGKADENSATGKDGRLLASGAVGLNDFERAEKLVEAGADALVLDIAHGHHEELLKDVKKYSREYEDVTVIVGNVATREGAKDLEEAGADVIKVGIGPGCLAEGTKILKAEGVYTEIENLEKGDKIINKNGEAVEVLGKDRKGVKITSRIKHSKWHEPSYISPDHLMWSGDLSSVSASTIQSRGYKSVLETKTKSGDSKLRWKELRDSKEDVYLLPSQISFELKDSFNIELKKRVSGFSEFKYKVDTILEPSYETGYLFGSYLGDGYARMRKNNSGSVSWYIDLNDEKTKKKIVNCITELIGKEPNVEQKKNNIFLITLYYNPLARYLSDNFGKKENKHLPKELLVEDKNYLKGLYDGLIDTDGHESNGRIGFTNTSENLIELFTVLSMSLGKGSPNIRKKEKSKGNLEGASKDNLKQPYRARINKSHSKRKIKQGYQVVKPLEYKDSLEQRIVYDIEVDCETNSFIAENMIVHNSACTTRDMTGAGVPQFTAVRECSDAVDVDVIADGGIRKPGDLAKALMAGASTGMIGGMFAGTKEAPGRIVEKEDGKYKAYRGMSSKEAAEKRAEKTGRDINYEDRVPEGINTEIEYKGKVKSILNNLKGGLKSSISYCGAEKLSEARVNAEFIKVTNSTQFRNGSHIDTQ